MADYTRVLQIHNQMKNTALLLHLPNAIHIVFCQAAVNCIDAIVTT